MNHKNKSALKLGTLILSTSLLSGCFVDKEKLITLGDAENLQFTHNGRLIATGGKQLVEITKEGSNYKSQSLYDGSDCDFAGLAQRDDWIYAVCNEGVGTFKASILIAPVVGDEAIQFHHLADINGFFIANGIDFTPGGDLLIANYDILGIPPLGLAKLDLNLDHLPTPSNTNLNLDTDSIVGELEHNWLPGNPNGVQVHAPYLFVTDGGATYRYELDAQDQIVDQVMLTHHNTFFDDLYPLCEGAIVTDFLNGRIFYVDKNGYEDAAYRTSALSFSGPSAIAIPPNSRLFEPNQLIVSEKGILFETQSTVGNRVSAVNLPFDIQAIEAGCR